MIRANTNLSVRETHNFTIDGFKGIDYSSGSLKANKQRAISAQNFEMKDGTIQKRHGWESLYDLSGFISLGYDKIFTNYYENGSDKFICIFLAKYDVDGWKIFSYFMNTDGTFRIVVGTLYGVTKFYGSASATGLLFNQIGEDLVIIGYGAFLVLTPTSTGYELKNINSNLSTISTGSRYAYCPTTTISLDPTEAATPRVQATLERPNILTGYRYNTGRSDDTLAVTQTFTLDAAVAFPIIGSKIEFTLVANIAGFTADAESVVSHDATNGYLVDTVNADGSNAYGTLTKAFNFTDNKKYFIRARMRVRNTGCTKLSLNTDLGEVNSQANPVKDTWYDIYDNIAITTDASFIFKHEYADAATAQDAIMEVDYYEYYNQTDMFTTGNELPAELFSTKLALNTSSRVVKVIAQTMGYAGTDTSTVYEIRYYNASNSRTFNAYEYRKFGDETWLSISGSPSSGYIVWNNNPTGDGVAEVVFNDFTYLNWTAVDDNLQFKFEAFNQDETYYTIKNCSIAVGFGADGNTTQLFLTGNPDYPNRDWYSYPLDPTYFPDNNYFDVGTTAAAITGYLRLSDGTLAIFKNTNGSEPAIYFRTGTLVLDETTLEASTVYTIRSGMLDYKCIAPKASVVVAGDPLFLTSNGVYAIVSSTDNTLTNKRFVRERSRFLGDIAWTSAAHAVAWDNKYLLSDGVENVYVADARYRRNEDQDMDDTFQYEWYHLKHIPATNFLVADGELYFTYNYDSMMGIAKFNDDYKDTLVFSTAAGNIALTEGADEFTKAASGSVYDLVDAAIVDEYEALYDAKFVTNGIYSYIFRTGDIFSIDAATGTVVLSEGLAGGTWENIYKLTDTAGSRTALTIQWATGSGKTNVVTVYVLSVDTTTLTFTVAETQTATTAYDLTALSGYASISAFIKPLYNTWLYAGHEGTVAWVTEYPESSQLRLTYINVDNPVTTPLLKLRASYLYDHEWYTPVFDMGTNVYQKELTSITAVVDPENSGAFYVGYETRGKNISSIVKGTSVMDFGLMSFEDLDFTSEFIKSYTKRVKTAFNYIIFRFTGKTDKNCVLNGLSVQFKVNAKNKGVR